MRVLYTVLASVWLAAAMGVAQAADSTAANDDPGKLVQGVAEAMLKDLDANREAYRQDPAKVSTLVEKHLLPNFDTKYSARLVLGRHWRSATPEQQQRFVDAFYQSLLRNYGGALVEFTGDKLRILPAQVDAKGENATVRTEVRRSNGQRIPVNYTLRKTPQGWKAWDVVIEGISYVKSFREDFGAEIDQKGLDAVIERIEKGGKPIPAGAPSTRS